MNRGELSGDDAINLIFRELDYQRKVKGSDEFTYDFTNKIAQQYLNRDDQEQILRTLNRQGLIELRIESASNDLESITGDDLHIIDLYFVDVTIPAGLLIFRLVATLNSTLHVLFWRKIT